MSVATTQTGWGIPGEVSSNRKHDVCLRTSAACFSFEQTDLFWFILNAYKLNHKRLKFGGFYSVAEGFIVTVFKKNKQTNKKTSNQHPNQKQTEKEERNTSKPTTH